MDVDRDAPGYVKSRFRESYVGDDSYTKVEKELIVAGNDERTTGRTAVGIRARVLP
jgi:hypothetical protein